MKQETRILSSEKEVSEAQEILDFVINFADNNGRYPKPHELLVKQATVVFHFGSFETLLQIARVGGRLAKTGGEDLPLRRPGSKRYCRYCGELLFRHRWFFCDDECERKFAEKDHEALVEASREIKESVKKSRRRMWHKCRECGEKCKIYLPVPLKEPEAKILCKASPEYQRLSEIYTYPFD